MAPYARTTRYEEAFYSSENQGKKRLASLARLIINYLVLGLNLIHPTNNPSNPKPTKPHPNNKLYIVYILACYIRHHFELTNIPPVYEFTAVVTIRHAQQLFKQYIGEMETQFIEETEMVFGNFEGKDVRSDLSRWNLFDCLLKAFILVVLPSTSVTPLNHGQFGGESFQLLNPGTTSCIFCGECLMSCEGPIRFKNKIHQIDRILKAVKNVPP